MVRPIKNSRQKILDAAAELAREVGPGHISLDAVAQRAGLSKGGLLYNFPSKAKLMEALVDMHVRQNQAALAEVQARDESRANGLARAIIDVYRSECGMKEAPPAGILAAIAENPSFIEPIRRHQRTLVQRLKAESDDTELALIAFLVIEGLRCLKLFEIDAVSSKDVALVLDRLSDIADRLAAGNEEPSLQERAGDAGAR